MAVRFLEPTETQRFRDVLNSDPEFRIAARFMSKDVLLGAGSSRCLIRIRNGVVTEMIPDPGPMDAWHFSIKASAESWEKFLQPLPPPFYTGLYAGMIRGTLEIEGDLEGAFAHFAAMSRMFDLLKQVQNS